MYGQNESNKHLEQPLYFLTKILKSRGSMFGTDISGGAQTEYSKPILSGHSKRRPKIGFQDIVSLNAGQKYCRMLPLEHSATLSTFIKLSFVIKKFVCLFLSGRL